MVYNKLFYNFFFFFWGGGGGGGNFFYIKRLIMFRLIELFNVKVFS